MRGFISFLCVVAGWFACIVNVAAEGQPELPGVAVPYHGPVVKGVDTSTLTGKVMCGYQGWFGAPGDGRTGDSWRHWTKDYGDFTDGNAKVDLCKNYSSILLGG